MKTKRKPTKNGKYRLTVPLSENILIRVEEEAKALGIPPATLAGFIIGNYYKKLDSDAELAKQTLNTNFTKLFEIMGASEELKKAMLESAMKSSVNDFNELMFGKNKKE